MSARILFVDDEPRVLSGLRRMLRVLTPEWTMHFVEGGRQALEFLAENPVDVVVSDLRMPGMDGAELLGKVRESHPGVVRIMLSGYVEKQAVEQAVLPAHQFLSKPCEPKMILSTIRQALQANALIADPAVRSAVAGIESLPSLPRAYTLMMEEIESASPSLQRVGGLVESDPGMCASILKMVNSSYFGFCQKISSPQQAVTLLGLDAMRSLVLSAHLFSSFDPSLSGRFSLDSLWEHSLRTSRLSFRIAEVEGWDKADRDDALAAGLLHDVGKLVLACRMPKDYDMILEAVRRGGLRVEAAERQHLGFGHAVVGAYLMSLWGLPDRLVRAIHEHHAPGASAGGGFVPHAVYVGNILDHKHCVIHPEYGRPELDLALLEEAGLSDRVAAWDSLGVAETNLEECPDARDPHR
ncbi:MAG: response regulator [Thermodesulfobacteriota bacterium]